jgi:hypothetical protein
MEEYPSLAEGIGLENRKAGQTVRGFESLFLLHLKITTLDRRVNINFNWRSTQVAEEDGLLNR